MKARLLKKLLNDTGYIIGDYDEYIAVGSSLCHSLISVEKKTLKLTYALDTWNQGRAALVDKNSELLFIWDTLASLIESGQIQDIIDGSDEIENPLPVYYVKDGEVIETFTDAYDWPNTTIDGKVMYNNGHFKTKQEAVQHGVREYKAEIESWNTRRKEIMDDLTRVQDKVHAATNNLSRLLMDYVL